MGERTLPVAGGDGPAPPSDVVDLAAKVEHLQRRLERQPTIEQAKGILMAYYTVGPEAAFEVLRRWSNNRNLKLHGIAELLVAALSHSEMTSSSRNRALDQVIETFQGADPAPQ